MKVSIEKKVLASALSAATKFVNTRSPLPILSHVLIESLPGSLRLTTTDLDVGLSQTLEAEVASVGTLTAPAALLRDIVSKMPTGTVVLERRSEGRMTVTCGGSSFEVSTLPGEEYPSVAEVSGEQVTLPFDALKRCVAEVAIAAASGRDAESRVIMSGINLLMGTGTLTMIATDGRRLACTSRATNGSGEFGAIVPAEALQELAKLKVDGDAHVIADGRRAVFTVGGYELHCRLLDGRFPDHTKVVPTEFNRVARISREELIDGVKRMLLVAQEKSSPSLIRFSFGEDLRMEANTPDLGSGTETLGMSYDGEPLTIGFNGKYLLDGLSVLDCDDIQIDLQGSTKSAVVRPLGDDSFRYVVMPVKLRESVED